MYTAVTNLTYRKLLRLSEDPLYTTCPSSRTSSSFDKGQLAPPNTPQLLRCSTSNPRTQSAVTTMWGVLGGRAVNLPILYGHLPSDHWPRYKGVIGLNLLPQLTGWSVPIIKGYIALILLSGKESNLTQPMDTTQYPFYRHLRRDAFTTSDTLSCRLSEAGFAISLHSLLILYQI